jgi:hypothetical protein
VFGSWGVSTYRTLHTHTHQDVIELCLRHGSSNGAGTVRRIVVLKTPERSTASGASANHDNSSAQPDAVSQALLSGEIVIERVQAAFLRPYSDGSTVRVPGTLYLTNYQLVFHGIGEVYRAALSWILVQH